MCIRIRFPPPKKKSLLLWSPPFQQFRYSFWKLNTAWHRIWMQHKAAFFIFQYLCKIKENFQFLLLFSFDLVYPPTLKVLLICRTVIIIIPPITLHSAIHSRQLTGSSSCASEPVSSWDVSNAVRNTSNLWSRGKLSENDQISLLLPASHNHKPSEIASQCCTDPLDPCKPSGQFVCGATLMISTLWNNRSFNFHEFKLLLYCWCTHLGEHLLTCRLQTNVMTAMLAWEEEAESMYSLSCWFCVASLIKERLQEQELMQTLLPLDKYSKINLIFRLWF